MQKPSKWNAAWTAAGLSLLFVVVYKGSNWLASQREDLPIWYYSWEQWIPFVPWTVVPYMSIDLLFIIAPFLCRTHDELRTLARRIAFATLAAGAFFLLMPLQMAGPRPLPDDWTRGIFIFLHGFDQPHNLFPSLHITFRTILAVHFARHTRGAVRWASNAWFSLIGISTLLTYQHHFADVASGFVLAILCLHLFRESQTRRGVVPNYRVGGYYAAGAVALVVPAIAGVPWAWPLLWPALALALVAAGYFGAGPGIYRKENGRIPWSTKLIMAPALIGQYLSLAYYRRHASPWSRITPQVWIGGKLTEKDAQEARRKGVTAVLDLTAEFSETKALRGLPYLNIPVLDLTAPTQSQLKQAVRFIDRHAATGTVYVHCKIGYSRSAAVVGAWLLTTGQMRHKNECISLFRGARRGIVVRSEVRHALGQFSRSTPIVLGPNSAPNPQLLSVP